MMILPRHAWDKHIKDEKKGRFLAGAREAERQRYKVR
jgi:hypothetical protein